ncbi:hypothetical protein CTI12_AA185170 [Artemisia annua]|uniref:F-box domain-containing protein n=1 Tax=Artemisia annua TaxID=35608 RepID=A0A2U1P7K1_ARTAN|nr:hypothetical protein CTI12_AA185170 [Artemisia annua]
MEQKRSSSDSVCDQLLPLCAKYPWFVAQNLQAEENSSRDQIFYTLHDPLTKYQCQIPEMMGRHIRGYYHGWVILSDHPENVMWSLWNPVTSKMIKFPPLILKDGNSESINECCLSAPPDNPSSVLLLTRPEKHTFVFYRLEGKRKKLRWIEMSYASQLKKITGEDNSIIYNLACCNGKVYALNAHSVGTFVIQIDILVKDKEVLIKLLLLGYTPIPSWYSGTYKSIFLKGYCTELFCILVCFGEETLEGVYIFRLDMASVTSEEMQRFKGLDMSCKRWQEEDWTDLEMSQNMWEELVDLKEAIFFVDLTLDCLVYYRPAIAFELGGYIHIRLGEILCSYHVKDNTVSLSSMPSLALPTSNVSLWECRLEDDHGEAKCTVDSKQEVDQIVGRAATHNEIGLNESNLLNLPFDILEMIMKLCVGVEYMNFRATCKRCHVAAPLRQWSNETSLRRLKTYSFVSPWLIVVDKNQGIVSFTDPLLGDKYFMKNRHVLLARQKIYCSSFGWLLFLSTEFDRLVFYNPFTSDLRKLPEADNNFMSLCFSAPPTSPDCMVVGFPGTYEWLVMIHFVAREPSWRTLHVGVEPKSLQFPTFVGQDLYFLGSEGELIGFKDLGEEDYSLTILEAKVPISCCITLTEYYLIKCDQDLLKVIISKFGELVDVFKWNDPKKEWLEVDSLGKHVIYICDTTCLSIEAKIPEMENKIFFPLLYSKNKKIVFYSLKTCMYHTFSGENIQPHFKDYLGTTYHLFPHSWIEPTWS